MTKPRLFINGYGVADVAYDPVETGLWVLNGHTASGTGLATWNTDTRVTKSVLLSIQVEISGVWYILSQGTDTGSIAQQANGYPQAYITASTFYDKDCRAVYYQTEE